MVLQSINLRRIISGQSGVTKASFYEPEINALYGKFAEHYDTVILPARVRKPTDKPVVVITTQYPPNKWHSLFDDPTIADAICDRLIPIAIKLNLKGKSLRGKNEKNSKKT